MRKNQGSWRSQIKNCTVTVHWPQKNEKKKQRFFLKMLLMLLPPINKISLCHFHTLCRLARFCVSSGFAPNKNMELVGKKKQQAFEFLPRGGFCSYFKSLLVSFVLEEVKLTTSYRFSHVLKTDCLLVLQQRSAQILHLPLFFVLFSQRFGICGIYFD